MLFCCAVLSGLNCFFSLFILASLSSMAIKPLPGLTLPTIGLLYKPMTPKGGRFLPQRLCHYLKVIKAELFRESRRRGQQNKPPEEALAFPLVPSGLCKPQHTHTRALSQFALMNIKQSSVMELIYPPLVSNM